MNHPWSGTGFSSVQGELPLPQLLSIVPCCARVRRICLLSSPPLGIADSSQISALAASSAPTPKGCCDLALDCISFSIPEGLLYRRAQLDAVLQDAASLAQKGGVSTVLVHLSQVQPSLWLAFTATKDHCWLAFNSLSTRNPRSFPRELQPSQLTLTCAGPVAGSISCFPSFSGLPAAELRQ